MFDYAGKTADTLRMHKAKLREAADPTRPLECALQALEQRSTAQTTTQAVARQPGDGFAGSRRRARSTSTRRRGQDERCYPKRPTGSLAGVCHWRRGLLLHLLGLDADREQAGGGVPAGSCAADRVPVHVGLHLRVHLQAPRHPGDGSAAWRTAPSPAATRAATQPATGPSRTVEERLEIDWMNKYHLGSKWRKRYLRGQKKQKLGTWVRLPLGRRLPKKITDTQSGDTCS